MAKSKSRIGFDPLAWMKGPSSKTESPPAVRVEAPAAKPAAVSKPTPVPGTAAPLVINLGEELLIADVGERQSKWKQALLGARSLELDGTRLQRVDTAGVQLLAALVRAAKQGGIETRWRGASDGLQDVAGRLGLKTYLSLS